MSVDDACLMFIAQMKVLLKTACDFMRSNY